MAFVSLSDLSSGAPVLSGTNGALCAVLDWALVAAGWAIEYTATNARVYRPAVGNRHRLHVNHDSAVSGFAYLATVRGCENATSATALIDPFPTVAQVANGSSSVCVSQSAGSTARAYKIVANDTFLLMAINTGGSNITNWDILLFGDVAPRYAGDAYGTIIHIGNATGAAGSARALAAVLGSSLYTAKTFWCRTIDGFTKSSFGCLYGSVPSNGVTAPCAMTNTPTLRNGYLAQIVREKVGASCAGTAASGTPNTSIGVLQRGWIPFLWNPMHSGIGTVTSDDVFSDTDYSATAQFMIVPGSSTAAFIIELTNTWSAPSG